MVNDPPLLASGPFSATTVEILKPALASVEEVPAKYSTESYSASDNEGDETDLPTTTTKIIVSVCEVGSETVRERRRNILRFGSSCWLDPLKLKSLFQFFTHVLKFVVLFCFKVILSEQNDVGFKLHNVSGYIDFND